MSSPISPLLYPLGFEPDSFYLALFGFIEDKVENSNLKSIGVCDNLMEPSREASDEDLVLADLALKCKRKKKMDNDLKHKNLNKAKLGRKIKINVSNVSLSEILQNIYLWLPSLEVQVKGLNPTVRRKLNALGNLVKF